MDTSNDPIKRVPSDNLLSPPKRICSPSTDSHLPKKTVPNIHSILHLPEDVVWSLRKQDLRTYFLTLQKYALNPFPIDPPSPTQACQPIASKNLPPFLRLPFEIRELIYKYTLPPTSNTLIRGPHPRQLHSHVSFSQPFEPSLLLINHLIRNEALPLIYGAPTQTVYITVDYNVWGHKTRRGNLVLSPSITASIKHLNMSIHLGSEKRNNKPDDVEAAVRVSEVKKGIKKVRKWLASANIQSLVLSWQEPPQTYTWGQKKEVLDGLRGLRAVKVDAGEINWGLNWNKGRKFRFEVEYFKELERAAQED